MATLFDVKKICPTFLALTSTLTLVHASADIVSNFRYQRKSSLANKLLEGNMLFDLEGIRSRVECGRMCADAKGCVALPFTTGSNVEATIILFQSLLQITLEHKPSPLQVCELCLIFL
jgi:hypothetical protein